MKETLLRAAPAILAVALVLSGCPQTTEAGLELLPAPELRDVQPEDLSITVNWTAVPQAEGYDVYYLKLGDTELKTAPVDGGEASSAEISGLEYNASYYVWVSARNSAGHGRNSAIKLCSTDKGKKFDLKISLSGGTGFSDLAEGIISSEEQELTLDDENPSVAILLEGDFVSYEWYVDNLLKGRGTKGEEDDGEEGNGGEDSGEEAKEEAKITLNARDYLLGGHRLDLFVYDAAGVPYSTGLDFIVE
jgi:hypothetical protein